MESLVTRFDGVDYAMGLRWFPHEDASKSMIEQARRDAALVGDEADMVLLFKGGESQLGLGFSSAGHKRGMPSLAAAISASGMSSWLVVLPLEDGRWWMGSCEDNHIDFSGDHVYTNETQVRDAFNATLATQEMGRQIFVPENWNVDGAKSPHVSYLLEMAHRSPHMRALHGWASWLPSLSIHKKHAQDGGGIQASVSIRKKELTNAQALIVVGVLAALVGGGYFGVRALTHKVVTVHQRNYVHVYDTPWLEEPLPRDVIIDCEELFRVNAQSYPLKWEMQRAECLSDHGQLTMMSNWRRAGGSDDYLYAAFGDGAHYVFSADHLSVDVVQRAVDVLPNFKLAIRAKEGLLTHQKLKGEVVNFGSIGMRKFGFNKDTAASLTSDEKHGQQADPNATITIRHGFGNIDFMVTLPVGDDAANGIPDIPGVIINAIQWETSGVFIHGFGYYRAGDEDRIMQKDFH